MVLQFSLILIESFTETLSMRGGPTLENGHFYFKGPHREGYKSLKGSTDFALKGDQYVTDGLRVSVRPDSPIVHPSHLGKVNTAPNEGLSGLPQSPAGNLQDPAHLQE